APLEIIIVDDGSKDDTRNICAEFPPPVRYILQENAGVSAARNRGVRESSGEWIAFLDSDDLWEPNMLEVQLRALEAAQPAGWSISDCVLVDGDDRLLTGLQGLQVAVPAFRESGLSVDDFFSELREVEIEWR